MKVHPLHGDAALSLDSWHIWSGTLVWSHGEVNGQWFLIIVIEDSTRLGVCLSWPELIADYMSVLSYSNSVNYNMHTLLFISQCHLLLTFANSLDLDQARQNVGPDLGPICLTLRWHSWNNSIKRWFRNKSADDKKAWKISQMGGGGAKK